MIQILKERKIYKKEKNYQVINPLLIDCKTFKNLKLNKNRKLKLNIKFGRRISR